MTLPYYLICELPDSIRGVNLIVHTEAPFEVGWVSQFRTEEEFEAFKKNAQDKYSQVHGYRIVVSYKQNLDGLVAPRDVPYAVLESMANYYYQNKIEKNAGYYKRYKQS